MKKILFQWLVVTGVVGALAPAVFAQARNTAFEAAFARGQVDAQGRPSTNYLQAAWSETLASGQVRSEDLALVGRITAATARALAQEEILKKVNRTFNCATFAPIEQTYNGRTYRRYRIMDPKHLSCLTQMPQARWPVTSSEWTAQNESEWQAFVQRIGESGCTNVDQCLTDPRANPYISEVDLLGSHYSDCADFPFYLRCYFAWKKGLPCVVPGSMKGNPLTPQQQERVQNEIAAIQRDNSLSAVQKTELVADIQAKVAGGTYARNGNFPEIAATLVPLRTAPEARNFFDITRRIVNTVSSGHMRVNATLPGRPLNVFYSPEVTRNGIIPGTVLYQAEGHVAMVFKVEADGTVRYVDAHPDNSVSRGVFNSNFRRNNPVFGDGFKNWRPYTVSGLARTGGSLAWSSSSRLNLLPDAQIATFSLEQYFGHIQRNPISWNGSQFCQADARGTCLRDRQGVVLAPVKNEVDDEDQSFSVVVEGRSYPLSIENFVQVRLSGRKINVLQGFTQRLNNICTQFKDRVKAVQEGVVGMSSQAMPQQLPGNIFTEGGQWFTFSTPGRDIRIRLAIVGAIQYARSMMQAQRRNDPMYSYGTGDFKYQAVRAYGEVANSCDLSYINSANERIRLSFAGAIQRVVRMSFVPYFCVEKRWGALSDYELMTCTDQADEEVWYRVLMIKYGDLINRNTNARFGQTLEQMIQATEGQELPNAQNFDLQKALRDLE